MTENKVVENIKNSIEEGVTCLKNDKKLTTREIDIKNFYKLAKKYGFLVPKNWKGDQLNWLERFLYTEEVTGSSPVSLIFSPVV